MMASNTQPHHDVAQSTSSKLTELVLYFLGSILLLLALYTRYAKATLPLTRDEGSYGYLGKMAVQGKLPYIDFYEMKPPFLFYLYGLGGSVFGHDDVGLRYFTLALTIVSCLLIFLLLKRFATKSTSLICSAAYGILSQNMYAFGFTAVAEHLVNPLLLGAMYLIWKRGNLILNLTLSGSIFAIAVLTKQTAVIFIFVYFYAIWSLTKNWKSLLYFTVGGAVVALCTLTYLACVGALDASKFWLIDYPAIYADTVAWAKGKLYLKYFIKNLFGFSPLLFLLACLSTSIAFFSIKHKHTKIFLLYFLTALITVIPGFRFYGQYWLLSFPCFAMVLAYTIEFFRARFSSLGFVVALFTLACIASDVLFNTSYHLTAKPTRQMEKLYENNPFTQIKTLSLYAKSKMKSSDRLMVFGSEPQAYLYTDKVAPTNHVYMGFLSRNIDANKKAREQVLQDLQTKNPEYILFNLFPFSWVIRPGSSDELYTKSFNYIKNEYTPIALYNIDQKQYSYADQGAMLDIYQPNQVILFKKR